MITRETKNAMVSFGDGTPVRVDKLQWVDTGHIHFKIGDDCWRVINGTYDRVTEEGEDVKIEMR